MKTNAETHNIQWLFVRAYLLEFQRCQQVATVVPKLAGQLAWQAPQRGLVKVNFDGPFNSSSKTGSFGVIARDCDGNVLGAAAGKLDQVVDSFTAESMAALKAITWARDMSFSSIVFEGDALTIIRKVTASTMDLSPISPYIVELKFPSSLFVSCLFFTCSSRW
ncbi:hypothetical protein COLO4_32120 [Corchorus olitorius]|uniref:RNase H type-1 domain-containing protein n=1 Tax=Corchorus olitorius TaxID=93759 RepID=A0A1R3H149_9ROSI|nr:hypothetical protein COLO4_32120 [Corchorus olitorius]